ncbi:MAG: site-2 protease family protein [Actinomycetota bacterium]
MGDTFRLGRIAGVSVGFHWSLIGVALLIIVQLADQLAIEGAAGLGLATAGALLFLGSVLLHELGHSVVARREGLEVDGISLWLLGGVARLRGIPETPGAEFRIAFAGPAASGLLAVTFTALGLSLDAADTWSSVADVLRWLGVLNAILFVFNLLPAAPLDGGRLLKSALWRWWDDPLRATIGAGRAGQAFGAFLLGAGVLLIARSGISGIWIVMIGWFVFAGAGHEVRYAQAEQRRHGAGELPSVVPGLPWPPPHDRDRAGS